MSFYDGNKNLLQRVKNYIDKGLVKRFDLTSESNPSEKIIDVMKKVLIANGYEGNEISKVRFDFPVCKVNLSSGKKAIAPYKAEIDPSTLLVSEFSEAVMFVTNNDLILYVQTEAMKTQPSPSWFFLKDYKNRTDETLLTFASETIAYDFETTD